MKNFFQTLALALSLCLFLPRPFQGAEGVGNNNPTGVTGEYNGSVTTGGSYDPYTGNAKRFIDDLTVTGSVGAYPLKWTRILNSRGHSGPFGDGGGWRHSYQWGLFIAPPPSVPPPPPCQPEIPDAIVYYPDGRTWNLRLEAAGYEDDTGAEPGDRLERVAGTYDYNLKLKDGGRVEFRTVNGYHYVPQTIVDPYGQATTLTYDSNHRLSRITEPAGRYLEITYYTYPGNTTYPSPVDVILNVKAYDGPLQHLIETVGYDYDEIHADVPAGGFHVRFFNLKQVNYDDPNAPYARYTYLDPALVFPSNLWSLAAGKMLTCDDVRFAGPMSKIKYEYVHASSSVGCPVAWGQIMAEDNMTTGQFVSKVDYPCPPQAQRIETRPDGATRIFTFSSGNTPDLESYTDFANVAHGEAHHTTRISYIYPPPPATHYFRLVTDARPQAYVTKTEKEGNAGAVIAVIHPNGSSVQFAYTDPANPYYVASKTDENHQPTYYDRYCVGGNPCDPNNRNRVWKIRYPDLSWEEFHYNQFGQVLEHTMTSGGLEKFTYDRGLKLTYEPPGTASDPNPGDHKTEYVYYDANNGRSDRIDRLYSVKDPLLHFTYYDYNQRGQVTTVTHHDGITHTESNYYPDGTLHWVKDELEHTTTYVYDEYKRVTSVTNAVFQETTNSYAPWNNSGALSHTTSSVYLTTLPSLKKIIHNYDSNFRVIQTTTGPGTGDEATTTFTYDEVGNQITVTEPEGQTGGLFQGAHSVFDYDDRNRRIKVTDALNHPTTWEYDDVGNMKKETRADTKFRTWDLYDEMNRIKHTTGFLGSLDHTDYGYDLAGNLQTMKDCHNSIYTYIYDARNRKETAVYPTDAASTGNNHRSELWRYDAAGNIRAYKNPSDDQWKHFVYDDRNRQTESYWNGSEQGTDRNQYIGDDTSTVFDFASRVTSITTSNANAYTSVAFGYDDANHKIWEEQRLDNLPTRHVETLPDADGNRITLTAGDYSLTYDYTQRQQLRHINGTTGHFFEYTYDKNGNLNKRQDVLQGNDSTNFTYDTVNRVTLCEQTGKDRITGQQDQPFSNSDYNDYDMVNNLKSISRHEDGDKGEQFAYDDANQLTSVSYRAYIPRGPVDQVVEVDKDSNHDAVAALEPDPVREPLAISVGGGDAQTGPRTVTYTNDPINRTIMNDNGTVTNYTPNGLNQYTAVSGHTAPVYDAKFNLSRYDGWMYVYDADNRLISATNDAGNSAQFVYDGLGRCVKRTIDNKTTMFTYDEWKPIVEWDSLGNPAAWNLFGPGADEILIRYQYNTGGFVHYHLDAMGNVQFLLGVDNLGLEKYTYDVFGKPAITDWDGNYRVISAYGNRFMFTGREYLYTLGIYDYRHRLYHPRLGRFIQTDPIGFKGDPMNLYRYCGADPVMHGDPTGLMDEGGKEARIPRDFLWDFARYGDSANTRQGDFTEYTGGAYTGRAGAGAQAASQSISPKDEGAKRQVRNSNESPNSSVPFSMKREATSRRPEIIRDKDGKIIRVTTHTNWTITFYKYGRPVGAGMMVEETIVHSKTVDFHPSGVITRNGPTRPDGSVWDPWTLPFTSANGQATTTQTIRAEGHQGKWDATVHASGEYEAEQYAPLQ